MIPSFDATEDAYWWVLCTEKYFKQWHTPETLKMTVASLAMKGPALTWWLRWYPRHPWVNWDAFTSIFLWRFKPEWRVILPLPDDEEDLELEAQQLQQGEGVVEQSIAEEEEIDDLNQHSSSLEVADPIEDSLVQSLFPVENPFNNEPLIIDSKCSPQVAVVDRDCCDKETLLNMDNKLQTSSIVIDFGVFNVIDELAQSLIRPPDPTNLVPIPPPPLAPPWLYRSVYPAHEGNTGDSSQLFHEVSTRTPSQFGNSIALQVGNTLWENSVSDLSVITRVFSLEFSACPIVIPLISVCGFFVFGTSVLDNHSYSYHTHHLFVESPLKTKFSWHNVLFQDMKTLVARLQTSSLQLINLTLGNVLFACDNFESLLMGMQNFNSFRQDYIDISMKCKEFSFDSAIEFSVVSLGLTKLVDNGQISLSSFFAVNPFGDIASPYGYMHALDCYGRVLLQVLIGKDPMKKIKSKIIDFHNSIMHHIIICKNLPIVDDYVPPSIVSAICNGRKDTSIQVANFGVEGDHIVYVDSAIRNHLEFLKEFSLVSPPNQVVIEKWLHVDDCRVGGILWKVCLIFSNEEHLSILQEVYTTNMFYLYHDPCYVELDINNVLLLLDWLYEGWGSLFMSICGSDDWKNNNKNWCELDCSTKSLVPFFRFDNLSQGPLSHEIIPYMIFSMCMLPCYKYARMGHIVKATLFNIVIVSKPLVIIFIDLEDKIIFRGVGNDMIYYVLVSCPITNMFCNEEIIGNNKDVEVQKLRKSRHMRINRLWYCYNNDNNRFLVYEFISNESLMGTLNEKKSLLDWHYSYSTFIVVEAAAEGLVYLHHNCALPIVHNMRSNKLLSRVAKIVIFESKVAVFMNDTVGSYGYLALVKRRERKKWGFGGQMCTTVWFSKFKQWDPGKICVVNNFYNLEDKVDFEGVGNVMILEAQLSVKPKIEGSSELSIF